MELCVTIPGRDLGLDAAKLRDFVQGAEDLGYGQVHVGEHVIGADITNRPGWDLPHTVENFHHETLTLLAFLAGQTRRMLLVSSVVILPQRPTVLVAKQAAEVDGLSGGRLRLGVGVGRVALEYEALGKDYTNRGRRIVEQTALLRALWTQPVVTFEGRWESVREMGLNPLPIQRPIPIWFGGGGRVDTVLRRIAAIGDGWLVTPLLPPEETAGAIERYRSFAREAGKDPATLPVIGMAAVAKGDAEERGSAYEHWASSGATGIAVSTLGLGPDVDRHLQVLREFAEIAKSSRR